MEVTGDKEDAKKQKVAVAEVDTAAEVAPEVSVKLEKGKMQQSIQSSLQACTEHSTSHAYLTRSYILSISVNNRCQWNTYGSQWNTYTCSFQGRLEYVEYLFTM
jgi:hypothetical protein